MKTQNEKNLKKLINEADQRFGKEAIAFWATKNYLLKVNIAALENVEPINKAHNECSKTLMPDYGSPYDYFGARLYITLVASFELFIQDILIAVITAYPKKVGQIEFKLTEILDAPEQSELVQRAIEETLNKIMYEKPLDYLIKIASLLSIDSKKLEHLWPLFIEAKARRDIGVHNGWKCNAIYLRKVKDAGIEQNAAIGDFMIPTEDKYIRTIFDALAELQALILKEVTLKYLSETPTQQA